MSRLGAILALLAAACLCGCVGPESAEPETVEAPAPIPEPEPEPEPAAVAPASPAPEPEPTPEPEPEPRADRLLETAGVSPAEALALLRAVAAAVDAGNLDPGDYRLARKVVAGLLDLTDRIAVAAALTAELGAALGEPGPSPPPPQGARSRPSPSPVATDRGASEPTVGRAEAAFAALQEELGQ